MSLQSHMNKTTIDNNESIKRENYVYLRSSQS